MLPVFPRLCFYLYSEPTDMRKSFDGLCGPVVSALGFDPLSSDVYAFVNRWRDRIKLLFWDRNGFWLFYKWLEKGTFQIPLEPALNYSIELSYNVLLMLLEGIDLNSIKRTHPLSTLPFLIKYIYYLKYIKTY